MFAFFSHTDRTARCSVLLLANPSILSSICFSAVKRLKKNSGRPLCLLVCACFYRQKGEWTLDDGGGDRLQSMCVIPQTYSSHNAATQEVLTVLCVCPLPGSGHWASESTCKWLKAKKARYCSSSEMCLSNKTPLFVTHNMSKTGICVARVWCGKCDSSCIKSESRT